MNRAPDKIIAKRKQREIPSAKPKPNVAFVIQRCGDQVNGGAETLCLQVGRQMARHWNVEILTTRALDYMTWEDHYPEGLEEDSSGLIIRRFSVERPRDVATFNQLNATMCELAARGETSPEDERRWMDAQGPLCPRLTGHIKENRNRFDAFFFFGYLYATTSHNLPLTRGKALLVPFAHDEWCMKMKMWDQLFPMPRRIVFSAPEEKEFILKRFPGLRNQGPTIGIGMTTPKGADPERFRRETGVRQPFLLYMGRVDLSKGCGQLFDYFIEFKQRHPWNPLKLVLLGKVVCTVPEHEDILALGFVDERFKYDAVLACEWLVNPSPHESLSIVLLEAWSLAKPVIVTASSKVLTGHCRRSNGGLWYQNQDEFNEILQGVGDDIKAKLAANGKEYVRMNYSWNSIENKFLRSLRPLDGGTDLPNP